METLWKKQKNLSFVEALAIVVGMIIGSGIFGIGLTVIGLPVYFWSKKKKA